MKVAIVGASGGIGQPLSLLMKLNPLVTELSLYDIRLAPGVAQDLSHISTNSVCQGFEKDDIARALQGAHVVIVPAGVPRKPGMTRDDLFKINASIVKGIVTSVAQYAPEARLLIVSNPVNSTVPIAVETLKSMGKLQPGNVMGVTTLDCVRAETFLGEYLGRDKTQVNQDVSVIGGHSGNTIVPVILNPKLRDGLKPHYQEFVHRVQFGGDEVVKAKAGAGSATLSMAFAGYRFADSILKSLAGEQVSGVPTFVYLPGINGGSEVQSKLGGVDYFALPVVFSNGSVSKVDSSILSSLSSQEKKLVSESVRQLVGNIDKGKKFALGAKL
ncbi:hypothetical protein ZYGR_0A03730 [Zygosaccharomyces rouxii]|uniref:Malate dehydrogenase n=2 Tax=Zygosaccharomyces rouxii TaxID=4956 RepID=C5DQ42_ZYGRC|nr:uncharacterized protein ZYRO0A08470g [Zygosaccharomyces rouxii]KAH9198677.1 lactate/malate dehydrogenase [Zygosaccharomyces rouxii]GAV46778.1 hypothetical protein ZYGR_0A03730 [Zygosaccharomyces rouxii]CAR25803.1 ZYRO0A08470p [Zygosaccharomyces rouxii]